MHPFPNLPLSAFLLLAPLSLSTANELLSCVEVECPGGTTSDCQVGNQTLNTIGLAPISVPSEKLQDQNDDVKLTWTVGFDVHDNIDPDDRYQRYIERVYYLGTPPSLNLTARNLGSGGCALYMTKDGNKNSNIFDPGTVYPDSPTSFCRQELDDDCMSALHARLSELAGEHRLNASEANICSSIASGLQEDLPSACTLLTSSSDVLVRSVPLTGSQAPSPLSEAQNSSSNCHPTLPKSNDLTLLFAYNISSSVYANETASAILGETPLWSLFWSKKDGDGDDDMIKDPDVQMVCLRPVDRTTAGEKTKVDGAASTLVGGNRVLSVWGAMVIVGAVMFSFGIF